MLSLEKTAEEWLLCSGTWSEIEFLHDNTVLVLIGEGWWHFDDEEMP